MTDKTENIRDLIQLRKEKETISPENPWGDDVLHRGTLAAKLTNLIKGQKDPYTISLHGGWGTGKTFLLTRWQEDLKKEGFKCIYYNAWEDDYLLADPLISIIRQLSNYFGDSKNAKNKNGPANPSYKKLAGTLVEKGKNFISNRGLADLVQHYTGVNYRAFTEDMLSNLLDNDSINSTSKKELKDSLEKISSQVKAKTDQPLVFIIDELDRCRPTFAIELLERVKHIFEIDNIVFIFGVNRDQLCKTVKSVYGDIDADIYLRRFFDMELILPNANNGAFCHDLINKHSFEDFFKKLSVAGGTEIHEKEYSEFKQLLIVFCGIMDLSLRDIQSCVNSMVAVGKNIERNRYMHPEMVASLIILRSHNNSVYKKFINGNCFASEIMDHVHKKLSISMDEPSADIIDQVAKLEGILYQINIYRDHADTLHKQLGAAHVHLRGEEGEFLTEYVSKKACSEINYLEKVMHWTSAYRRLNERQNHTGRFTGVDIKYLAHLIDLFPPSR